MTFRGKIQGNVILLDQPTGLPDGTEVSIAPIAELGQSDNPSVADTRPASTAPLSELLLRYSGIVKDGRTDGSRNHDHYIYGSPKR